MWLKLLVLVWLSLNLDKTNFSVFGAGKSHINFELIIDGIVIKQVNTCKYLGITIDDKLSSQDHIDFVYNKVVRFVSIFYCITHRLSCELSKMMYFAFVCSHLCYGIEIYGNTYHSYINKLIILNNKILRILQNDSYRTYVTEFCEHYKFITPFQFQNSTIIEFCYWFINLLTIRANYLLYFQHILMIINYFMNIILVGKKLLHLTGWLAAVHWTQMYKI